MTENTFPPPNDVPPELAQLIGRAAERAVWQAARMLESFPTLVALERLQQQCREAANDPMATPSHAEFMATRADALAAAHKLVTCQQRIRDMLAKPCECDECLNQRAGHA